MSIKQKIALSFAALSVVILGSLSLGVYFFFERYVHASFEDRLEERVTISAQASLEKDELSASIYQEIIKKHLRSLPEEKEYFIPVDSLTFPTDLSWLPPDFFAALAKGRLVSVFEAGTYASGLRYEDNQGTYWVILQAKNPTGAQQLARLRQLLAGSGILATGLALLIGHFFAQRIVHPVTQLIAEVERIRANQLHRRLPVSRNRDELAALAQTFNQMLDRLQAAFEIQQSFIANASHELRTPLTTLQGEAEWALQQLRSPEAYRQALKSIEQEADRLSMLVNSLLNLSNPAFDGQKQVASTFRLDELLLDLKTQWKALIPGNQVQLNFASLPEETEQLTCYGQEAWLAMAITNLVQNACHYSDNTPVEVSLVAIPQGVRLVVTDQGIGIPAVEVSRVEEPFFRASNAQNRSGHGIGLALASKVFRLHQGKMEIVSQLGAGTTVSVEFPLPPPLPEAGNF